MADREESVEVVVSVSDTHLDAIDDVVARLEAAGMRVSAAHRTLGAIEGVIAASKVGALSRVEGVSHVTRSQTAQLPPPGSGVQ